MTSIAVFRPGKVAVVTGAALGIGRAMCERFAQADMSVVLADLPGSDLDAAVEAVVALSPRGRDAIVDVPTDVADQRQIENLCERATTKFGNAHILVNNAATRVGRGHQAALDEWRRAMNVNLFGPVLGVRAFLPSMLASRQRCIIVNVGSKQGITNPPGHPIYNMTKAALKTYTEALEHELRSNPENQGDDCVTAHLLVPGWTTTGKQEHKSGAWLPEQVVDAMIAGIVRRDFYIICPDGEVSPDIDRKRILWAASDITENRPPLSRWHPKYAKRAKAACEQTLD
jgi:NAD(P)-dependent dehydrogenase (short-subunit alcohol dehydrogenase family)